MVVGVEFAGQNSTGVQREVLQELVLDRHEVDVLTANCHEPMANVDDHAAELDRLIGRRARDRAHGNEQARDTGQLLGRVSLDSRTE